MLADPVNMIDPTGSIAAVAGGGLSTTAATAITLGEFVVKSVRHASKTVSVASKVINISSITVSAAVSVCNVINTNITTEQIGDRTLILLKGITVTRMG